MYSNREGERFYSLPPKEGPWPGVHPLLIAFSDPLAKRTEDVVVLRIAGERYALSLDVARSLHVDLHDALTERQSFVHTTSVRHVDGRYIIERRRAASSGNQIAFDSIEAVQDCFDDLPDTFGAADVEYEGITGSRRHLLVRHFAESAEFTCELICENPLQAKK